MVWAVFTGVKPWKVLVGHSSGAQAAAHCNLQPLQHALSTPPRLNVLGDFQAMRLAEEEVIGGLVLVAACHSHQDAKSFEGRSDQRIQCIQRPGSGDLGDAGERASGYYPPKGGPWNWEPRSQRRNMDLVWGLPIGFSAQANIRRNTGWIATCRGLCHCMPFGSATHTSLQAHCALRMLRPVFLTMMSWN